MSALESVKAVLELAHSGEADKQQQAATQLATVSLRLVPHVTEGSFGPILHAILRLMSSEAQATVAYATRALKNLLVSDVALREAGRGGAGEKLVEALGTWGKDVTLLREVVPCVQSLSWCEDTCACVVPALPLLVAPDLLQRHGCLDVQLAALRAVANLMSHLSGPLLEHGQAAELAARCVEPLLGLVACGNAVLREAVAAALRNGTDHPRVLATLVAANGGERLHAGLEASQMSLSVTADLLALVIARVEGSELPSSPARKMLYRWGNVPLDPQVTQVLQLARQLCCRCFS